MTSPGARVGLLDWLADPRPDRGLRFLRTDGSADRVPYPELARRVRGRAAELSGLAPGELVALMHDTGPDFVSSFFGVLHAGGTPAPLSPAVPFADRESWLDHVARAVAAGATTAVCDERFAADLRAAAGRAGRPCRIVTPGPDDGLDRPAPRRDPASLALLQFTSGSRGASRATRIGWDNLETNIAMIRDWTRMGASLGVSWLPLHHDMGLIGGLLAPVLAQADQGLMRPEQFIRSPLSWLRQYHDGGGQVMAMPNFGFDYLARRLRPAHVAGLDLSGVDVVVTGSERVRRETLDGFLGLLAPCGLRPSAMQPGYGLAEATLGVTGVPYGRPVVMVAVRPGPVRLGQPVEVLGEAELDGTAAEPAEHVWHVSCGPPLAGVAVDVLDADGVPLPEGHLGEIEVSGPSVALGYLGAAPDGSTRFTGGRLRTADAGFRYRGDVYVLGRIGDSMQVRGRNLYVEDIEQVLAEDIVFPWRRTVVLAGYLGAEATVLIATESGLGGRQHEVLDRVTSIVGPDVTVRVVQVPPSTLVFTSSGKPRRRLMWTRVLAGELTGDVLADSGAAAEAVR
ncbi:AMP-dependent synthetase and ligase [Micromonospora sp. ATCC 39149]|uniref:AMP-binding protein n=1 Tax=Micromonospora carbonacea TaxID=47853 RepID=A0A7D5Y7W7_9ACTN|nr:AMP-binding protein [Micromonospora sp. ATCC 39149]EEP70558.1 AMP-dependent synthetase and ligase [Micromonospora sp. ATCC 39149]QLJ96940.1 AMP-binding protein [Micromonospora carbonacea]